MDILSQYKTQKALKAFVRKFIDEIGPCVSIKENYPDRYDVLLELFKRHSDYPKKFIGLKDIMTNYNPFSKNLEVIIKKDDGTTDAVSVLQNCITGKPKDKLNVAMRVAINSQIQDFKGNTRNECEICGEINQLEVDHHYEKMPFAKLYKDFIKINVLKIPTTFDDTIGHLKCFKEEDNMFKDSWIDYHRQHSILRMLCGHCNRSQPKYK
jgi:hypothetical protein